MTKKYTIYKEKGTGQFQAITPFTEDLPALLEALEESYQSGINIDELNIADQAEWATIQKKKETS